MDRLQSFITQKRLSLWIGVMILLIVAIMMQPGFSALLAGFIIAILLWIMRWVAHIEGRKQL